MGTKNPKVSAYVPQALKDCVEKLAKERDISESQLLTIILAEYFQMPEVLGRSLEGLGTGNQIFTRMEAIEEKVSNFINFAEERLQQLDKTVQNLSNPPVDHYKQPKDNLTDSELTGTPLGELPNQGDNEGEKAETIQEVNNSNSLSEPLDKGRPEFSLPSESLNNLISKPLSGKTLAKRLGYHPDSLSKVKTKATEEEFFSLSADKDPDGIAWKFVKKSRGYLPANELSSELQGRLLNWLKENFPEY